MKNKKLSLLLSLAATFVVSVCATVGVWSHGAGAQDTLSDPVLVGGEIEEEYLLGEYLAIPSAQITCGDETADARIIVKKPNGELVQTSNVSLTQGGIYTVEYRASFGDQVKTIEKTFVVQTPLFSAQSKNTTAVYGFDSSQYETGIKGVNVDLAEGDILTYNDVIDLNESNGEFLEFLLPPSEGPGTADFRRLTVTLTDLHNPDIVLTVIAQCSRPSTSGSNWYYDWTYVLAGGQNQTPSGVENEQVHVGNDWGCPTRFSYYGMHGETVAVGTETLKLIYDQNTNAVYANDKKVVTLTDLTIFGEAWKGFTTGEVKMTIKGDYYNRPFGRILITRIGMNNLNQAILYDNEAPEITVNYDGYDAENLPNAATGLSYPVFNATAMDKAFGVLPVKTTVYYGYESTQRYQVAIENGAFKTARAGYYTIEYTSTDGYGNVGTKTVVIECKDTSAAISVEAQGEYATTAKTGEALLPAEIAYEGGTGAVKTYATVKAEGLQETVMDGGFRPENAIPHTVTLYAVDMLGKTVTCEYTVEVSVNDTPVFLDEVVLPRYFLSGYNYNIPSLAAYDYSNGKVAIATTISVKDGGEVRELTDGVGDFIADENGYATIVYTAVGAKGSSTKEYQVPVVDTWLAEESLDMSKYFYGENITSVADEESVKVSSTVDTEYTFVNPVVGHKFEMRFEITGNAFSCLQLVFADAVDPSIQFTLEIENAGAGNENALLKINGVATRERTSAGFHDGNAFTIYYNNVTNTIQEGVLLKQTIYNADGSEFEGFPSKLMYVTARVIGVEGTAELSWMNFGGQMLDSNDVDNIKPSIAISREYESSYAYQSTCEIYPAVSADVLSPETYGGLTVYDPNGNIVKDVDGTLLENVSFDRSYFISLDYYGSYSIVYSSKDWFGREQEYFYALYVADVDAPIISLMGETQTQVALGESITIVKAIAVDNVEGEVEVYTYLVDPEGLVVKVTNGGTYVTTTKGVYEIRYMSLDSFGNLRIVSRKVTVV